MVILLDAIYIYIVGRHQLLIASGADTHTHTNTHTNDPHRINFKKPGVRRPAAGARLV